MSAALQHDARQGAPTAHAARDRVDVWRVALDPVASAATLGTLCESERAFAARLRVGAGEWASARAELRRVLGRYLGLDPRDVRLETGPHGKPRLPEGTEPDVRFNLSHSGRVALIAVRLGADVGIDVEQVRPGVDGASIARDVCIGSERAGLALSGASGAGDAFFRAWVRREAIAKASGRGIVPAWAADDAARCTVRGLDGIPGYAAALASEGNTWVERRVPRSPSA